MSHEPRLIIFSGAGLDAASGIPTFRDSNGLWEGNDVMEVCTMSTFEQNYEKVHRFYNQMRTALANVEPNSAHKFIAEMQDEYGAARVVNFTANVSDLLERANVQNVRHVHGILTEIITDYKGPDHETKTVGYTEYDFEQDRIDARTFQPNCKPNVVFFGEMAPMYAEMDYILQGLRPQDTFVIVGSTLEVNPVHHYAWGKDCYSVIINPSYKEGSESPLDIAGMTVTSALSLTAEDGFECIRDLIKKRMG
ncbi:Sir2 family protein [Vibrio phage 2.275.O._10N.286.54.E11]|nr:Sir2 family protein [Vibrio phage 2.275.O._10N.286.54.E11]